MPNVTIENTANNLLEFGLRLESGALQIVKLAPGETLPNAQYPDDIPDSQLTEYTRDLARNGSLLITATEGQTIAVEFQSATSDFDRDTGDQNINVVVTTSDGADLGEEVTVEVQDDGTGSATEGSDYNYSPNPKTLTFPAGSPSGSVQSATVNLPSSSGPDETVDFSLANPTNATIGAQSTHELTINTDVTQTVTVEFVNANSFFDNVAQSGNQNIGVKITTSDAGPLLAPVSVDVLDLLSGTAGTPGAYTFTSPQTLNWSIGEADQTVKNAVINIVAFGGPPGTVDLDLDNPSGATEGAQNTHEVTIVPGAGS